MESPQANSGLPSDASSRGRTPETLPWLYHSPEIQASPLQYHQTAEPLQEDHRQEAGAGDENRASEEAGSRETPQRRRRATETKDGRGRSKKRS